MPRNMLRGIQSVVLDFRLKHFGMIKNLNRAMHDCILRPPVVMPADFLGGHPLNTTSFGV
jgi:hypothetical protein